MKARFKTIILSALGAVIAFSAVTYTSCNSDKCQSIVCAYGGVCKDGVCICPTGYEGVQCETVTRDKFIGTWNVSESGTLTSGNAYTVSIEPYYDSAITSIIIKNFYNRSHLNVGANYNVVAYVKADTIYINQQVVDGDTIIGNGYLQPDAHYAEHGKLTMYYVVKNGQSDYFGFDSTGSPSVWEK